MIFKELEHSKKKKKSLKFKTGWNTSHVFILETHLNLWSGVFFKNDFQRSLCILLCLESKNQYWAVNRIIHIYNRKAAAPKRRRENEGDFIFDILKRQVIMYTLEFYLTS